MTADRTYSFIQVADETFDWWENYSITHDVLNGTSPFSFTSPILSGAFGQRELTARGLAEGQLCDVFVTAARTNKPVQVLKGRILEVTVVEDRQHGAVVQVSGNCHMHELIDADTYPSIALEAVSFADVARRLLVEQFGYASNAISIDNDANRALTTGNPGAGMKLSANAPQNLEELKVFQAKPQPGETVHQFLHRHATRFGLLMWGTADGKIVFGRPNYEQAPLYSVTMRAGAAGVSNNAKRLSRKKSVRHRPVEVHVYGHSHGHDAFRSPVHGVAVDEEMAAIFGGTDKELGRKATRILTVHDQRARTQAQAEQRAKFELSVRRQGGDVVNALMVDHASEDGSVYAVDTTADVQWDRGSVHTKMYVAGRTFTRSRDAGTETTLDLVRLNSIALGGA